MKDMQNCWIKSSLFNGHEIQRPTWRKCSLKRVRVTDWWWRYYVGNDLDLSLINNNHNNNYNNSTDSSETSGVRAFSPARTSPVCSHGVLDYRNCGVSPFQPISFYMTLDREDNLLLLCLRHACLPRQAPSHSKNIPNSSTRSSHTPFFFFFCWTKWITKSILCPLGRSHLILFLLQALDHLFLSNSQRRLFLVLPHA